MNDYYVLAPEEITFFGRKWAYAEVVKPVNYGDCEYCPVCHRPVSSRKWLPPYKVRLSNRKPERWGDFVWGAGFSLLVSSRFKGIYESEGLKGIDEFSEPVEITGAGTIKSSMLPVLPVYHHIHVPWGGANQDDVASHMQHEHPEKRVCSFCKVGVTNSKQDRIVIEENSWDGSDIFTPRGGPTPFMVSERFKYIVEQYKLMNVLLIPAEKFGYDPLSLEPWYINN
jgi:hypothetical protein